MVSKCCRYTVLLLSLAYAVGSLAGMNTWTSKGPPGGSLRAFATSPVDPNIAYAAYWTTLYKSVDGGANWQVLRELHSTPSAFFVDPSDGNRFYLSASGEGILRSDNAGQSYQRIAPDPIINAMGGNSSVIYYMGGSFRRSMDRGQTWETRTAPPTFSLTQLFVGRQDPNVVVGIYNGAAVRSLDGGATWSTITLGASAPYANQALILSSSQMLIAASDGIYRSTDGGATWIPTYTAHAVGAFAIDLNAVDTILAASDASSSRGQLIRSTNNGVTWTALASSPHGTIQAIAVRASSSSQLLIANDQGVLRSSNNGSTWMEAVTQPGGSSVIRLTAGGSNSKVYALAYGRSSGIFSTSLDGPWQRVDVTGIESSNGGYSVGFGVLAVKPNDPGYLLFLPRVHQGFYSSNGGTNWTMSTGLEMFRHLKTAVAFDPLSPSTVYASVQPDLGVSPLPAPPLNGIYRSLDSGVTWASHSTNLDPNVNGERLVIDPRNSARMYLTTRTFAGSGGPSGLYRSIDSGVTWSRTLDGEDVRGVAVSPADSNRVYVATSSGLQISNDGGATFTANAGFATLAAEQASAVAVDPIVPTTLYAASQNPVDRSMPLQRSSTILRSVDDGLSWEVLRGVDDDPEWLVGTLVLDPARPSLIYVDTEFRGVGSFEVAPDLALSIRGHAGVIQLGTTSTFDLRLENRGSNAATNVRAIATLPPGLRNVSVLSDRGTCSVTGVTVTCSISVLQSFATMTAQVSYSVQAPMSLPLTAVLSAHERDSSTSNNTATATAIAGEVVDLGVTVTASAQSVGNGDTVTFTVQASNGGPADATNSTITLTPGAGITFGTPPAGCTVVSITVTCETGLLTANSTRTIAATATATGVGAAAVGVSIVPQPTAIDLVSANNTANATINAAANGDLSVSITDSVDPVLISTNFDYQVIVRNEGPDTMSNVVATLINSGTTINIATTQGSCSQGVIDVVCSLGAIGAGGIVSITIKSGSSSAGTISLQAMLAHDGVDRVPSTNSAHEFTAVVTTMQKNNKRGGALSVAQLFSFGLLLLLSRGFRLASR